MWCQKLENPYLLNVGSRFLVMSIGLVHGTRHPMFIGQQVRGSIPVNGLHWHWLVQHRVANWRIMTRRWSHQYSYITSIGIIDFVSAAYKFRKPCIQINYSKYIKSNKYSVINFRNRILLWRLIKTINFYLKCTQFTRI